MVSLTSRLIYLSTRGQSASPHIPGAALRGIPRAQLEPAARKSHPTTLRPAIAAQRGGQRSQAYRISVPKTRLPEATADESFVAFDR